MTRSRTRAPTPPTSGNHARFNNNTPGSYAVTCSIKGVAAGSTTMTVAASTISVAVEHTGRCDIVLRFLGSGRIDHGGRVTPQAFNVTPPAHFQAACDFGENPFQFPLDDQTPNSNTTLSYNARSLCG